MKVSCEFYVIYGLEKWKKDPVSKHLQNVQDKPKTSNSKKCFVPILAFSLNRCPTNIWERV